MHVPLPQTPGAKAHSSMSVQFIPLESRAKPDSQSHLWEGMVVKGVEMAARVVLEVVRIVVVRVVV